MPGCLSVRPTLRFLLAGSVGLAFILMLGALAGCSRNSAASSPAAPSPVSPAITAQPQGQSVYVGDTATFSVVATGTPVPVFQWARNGAAIAGANGSSYTTATLTSADDGSTFNVTASNIAGTVTSTAAKLSVAIKAPAITLNPSSVTVSDGDGVSFSVTASGSAPLSYQWRRGGTSIAGATSATYSLPGITVADSGSTFAASVTNSAGTAISAVATLTVIPAAPKISTQPAATTRFVGETATFSVVATGTTPNYQWRKNATAIPGATSASYTTPPLLASDDQTSFDVVVANPTASVTSSPAPLRVGPFSTAFTTQKGVKLNLYAWPGAKYAYLSKTATLNPAQLRQILAAADGAWNYYADTVGKLPSTYVNYNGLATIADTGVGGIDLCGDGCTYLGATGMEISDRIANLLYANVPTQYDWVMFYETGRSFWLFDSQLAYKSPDNDSCEVTGFAVFMGIHSLLGLGLPSDYGTNIPNNPDPFKNELLALSSYAANPSLNFANTFQTSTFVSPYGDCPVLWTGLVQQLSLRYGGEAFIQALFKEVLKRPAATSTQDAVDNFILAASAAAGKNLTYTFNTTWKWPVSAAATQEAQTKYGTPQ